MKAKNGLEVEIGDLWSWKMAPLNDKTDNIFLILNAEIETLKVDGVTHEQIVFEAFCFEYHKRRRFLFRNDARFYTLISRLDNGKDG